MNKNYDDIINMPHHVSKNRAHMSVQDRAAQFAPFKALVGLDGEISETARQTSERLELSEDELENLNRALQAIKENIRHRPRVKVIYFVPDAKKAGGAYLLYEGNVRHIDEGEGKLCFVNGPSILISDIYEIYISYFFMG